MSRVERLYGDILPDQPRLSRQQLRELADRARVSVRQDAIDLLPDYLAKLKTHVGLPLSVRHITVKSTSR